MYKFAVNILNLVPPRGIEPRSSVLQTGAMTTSAKAANFGAPSRNRTPIAGLQNRCLTIKRTEQIKQDRIKLVLPLHQTLVN